MKDAKNQIKIDKKQPEESGFKGYLRLPKDKTVSPAVQQYIQERHNSGHALWYFSMAAYFLAHRELTWREEKTDRILAHLSCLREFIPNEDRDFSLLVTTLQQALETEYPDRPCKWLSFIHKHWDLLCQFADRYGDRERCFTQGDYEKIAGKHKRARARRWIRYASTSA